MKLLELYNEGGKKVIVEADTETEKGFRGLGYSEDNKPEIKDEPKKEADAPKKTKVQKSK